MPDSVANTADRVTGYYDLLAPVEIGVLPDAGGINNRIRGVRTGAGTFVWKTYLSQANAETIRYEHRLLAWLAEQGLSFATPRAIPTRTGDTLAPIPDATGWQALFSLLPGRPPDQYDPAMIEAVGAAIGELHGVLARYPTDPRPGVCTLGTLNHLHPAVPNAYDLTPAGLGIIPTIANEEILAWWRAALATLRSWIDGPYRTLPRQVIHGDFVPGNTLARDGRIVAVLDFEFAALDVRAIDIASGLTFVMRSWERTTPDALTMARRFLAGYGRHQSLSVDEIEALPHLMLLRDVAGIIRRIGNGVLAGDPQPPVDRIATVRAAVDWLADNGVAFRDAIVSTGSGVSPMPIRAMHERGDRE